MSDTCGLDDDKVYVVFNRRSLISLMPSNVGFSMPEMKRNFSVSTYKRKIFNGAEA